MTGGGDFWSRRRAQVAQEEAQEANAAEAAALEQEAAAREELSDAEICAELNLPNPEDLEPGQDIAGFMNKAVPERLRRRALRQLWHLNPVLANLDGLCDYNGDFTDAAMVKPGMKTAYQVGKGMLKHIEALEAEKEAKAKAAEAAQQEPLTEADQAEDVEVEVAPPAMPDKNSQEISEENQLIERPPATNDAIDVASSEAVDLGIQAARPRRMRFVLSQETT